MSIEIADTKEIPLFSPLPQATLLICHNQTEVVERKDRIPVEFMIFILPKMIFFNLGPIDQSAANRATIDQLSNQLAQTQRALEIAQSQASQSQQVLR